MHTHSHQNQQQTEDVPDPSLPMHVCVHCTVMMHSVIVDGVWCGCHSPFWPFQTLDHKAGVLGTSASWGMQPLLPGCHHFGCPCGMQPPKAYQQSSQSSQSQQDGCLLSLECLPFPGFAGTSQPTPMPMDLWAARSWGVPSSAGDVVYAMQQHNCTGPMHLQGTWFHDSPLLDVGVPNNHSP